MFSYIPISSMYRLVSYQSHSSYTPLQRYAVQFLQINFDAIELVYGPFGLESAIFLADVLVKYHQQLRLEHTIRYVTSDCAKSFGKNSEFFYFFFFEKDR